MSRAEPDVVNYLSRGESYPHGPERVEVKQTHASWVFLAPPFVYKVKKAVNFGFIDFSTLELRRQDCEREVALNRRLAEDVYLEVLPICETDGSLHFGAPGTAVEYAVKMRLLSGQGFLISKLERGEVSGEDIDRILSKLEHFYLSSAPPPVEQQATATERMHKSISDNLKVAAEFVGPCLQPEELEALQVFNDSFFSAQSALLESRITGGWIRDCHGDLHSEHIHLSPEAVRIYDCIEFNTRFRYIDLAADLAFLAMDLDFHGAPALSRRLTTEAQRRFKDPGMGHLMDFYKCYRACVRAKVNCLTSRAETASEDDRRESLARAQRYFHLALRYALIGSAPCVILIGGRVGSGKSLVAERLGAMLECEVHSSDRIRKELAGIPLHERGSKAEREVLYNEAMSVRTYREMVKNAYASLSRKPCTILDATFSKKSFRERTAETFQGLRLIWIEVYANEEVTHERLVGRETQLGVVSDARAEDKVALDRRYEPFNEIKDLIRVPNNGSIQLAIKDLCRLLIVLEPS